MRRMPVCRVLCVCAILVCLLLNVVDAQSDVPTLSPTTAPSVAPSVPPSPAPSAAPSEAPTAAPTIAPTATPTATPTELPTTAPTVTPSLAPTVVPTPIPTVIPTVSPSVVPSLVPTAAPSTNPSLSPSASPSLTPTAIPTVSPSAAPSLTPTVTPTVMPTVSPPTSPTAGLPPLSGEEFYALADQSPYRWNKAFPQSCSCWESGVTESSCELFKCGCVCDVTAGKCDYGCCCDPDCTAAQIDRFRALDACVFEGDSPQSLQYCYSSSELYAVNPRGPLAGDSTTRDAVGKALCVEKTNYAFKSDFYVDQGLRGSQIFDQSSGQKEFAYTDSARITTNTASVDNFFDQNDSVAAFFNNSRTFGLVAAGVGFWQIPRADISGQCNDWNFAQFERDIDSDGNACQRTIESDFVGLQSQCDSQQSVSRFVDDLWLGKSANIVAATGVIGFADVVHVQLARVLYRDSDSGRLVDVTSLWKERECRTVALNESSFSSSDPCFFASVDPFSVTHTASYSLLLCSNAIQAVQYTVNHTASGSGAILSVSAEVTVTDVRRWSSAQTAQLSWRQSFGVTFNSVDAANLAAANGNLVPRKRSGNPGYVLGAPVLFAYANGSRMNELVDGLSLPVAQGAAGACPTGAEAIARLSTSFGYDSLSGCLLSLSRQELKDFCCTGAAGSCVDNAQDPFISPSPFAQTSSGLPYFLNVSQGFVGIYGAADPLDVNQWFPLTINIPADSRRWNDKTSTCSNVFSGLNVQFLVSYTGEKTNPQNKIVAARAEYITSDWTLEVPAADRSSRQAFQLSVVASYVWANDEATRGYVPPPPPMVLKVPHDVFYPFLKSDAASLRLLSPPAIIISVIVSICLSLST